MSEQNKEALKALRDEVRQKGAAFFDDVGYQAQVVDKLEEIGVHKNAGDLAGSLGMEERAQGLWRIALDASDLNQWTRKELLEKVGDEDALRAIDQEEFDTSEYAYSVIEAGEKLGIDRDTIVARVLPILEVDKRPTEQASYYMKLGFAEKAIELTLADFAEKDAKRQQDLRSWQNAERAEKIYRHDMSHAISRAIAVGDLDTIKEGYRQFMASVLRDCDAMYVERLVADYETLKEKFAEQGTQLDPNDFFFAERKDDVLGLVADKANFGDEYGSGAELAGKIYALAGLELTAMDYFDKARKRKAESDENRSHIGPSFEDLVADGKYASAFSNAQWNGKKDKAETVYERAVDEVFADGWRAGEKAAEMARFLDKEEDAKLYDVLKLI